MAERSGAGTGPLEVPPDRGRLVQAETLSVLADVDIAQVRERARRLSSTLGFSPGEQAVIAAAVSEIARNLVRYARNGTMELRVLRLGARQGLRMIARDEGPGIPSIPQAMQDGFSTSRSLGLGLSAAQRVMDEFTIVSHPGVGTMVAMTKWGPEVL
jgi:serine/threonine-protein kinase RsbT